MTVRTLPGLGLTGFWLAGSNGWGDEMDANLRVISALLNGQAKSRTVVLPGAPTLGDIYIVKDDDGTNPDKLAVWDGEVAAEAWVFLTPQTGWSFYVLDESTNFQYTGAAWEEFAGAGGGGGGSYDVQLGFVGTPTTSQVVESVVIVRDWTIPADMAGTVGALGANPAASYVMSLQDDAVEIGTITFSTGGAATFTTTGSAAIVVSAGSLVTLVAPAAVDASISDMAMTILGSV